MDHYERLRVSRRASRAQIRAAYLRLIAVHHPDRSSAPDAEAITAELNEAYSVLEDREKRRAYDETLRSAATPGPGMAGRTQAAPPRPAQVPQIRCEKCGAMDSSLRLATFFTCVAFMFKLSRTRDSGIRCVRCRNGAAIKANLITAIAGWWSPQGIIYAPHALWVNSGGGSQDPSRNGALLRVLGQQLFARGEFAESARALRASVAFTPNERTSRFLEYVSATAGQRTAGAPAWNPKPFFAAVVAPLCFSACAMWVGLQPAARWLAGSPGVSRPTAIASAPAPLPPPQSAITPAALSDPEVARLAAIVEVRSPFVGTHSEGQTTVQDHVLDRSRFDASEIDQIADSIGKQIGRAGPSDSRVVAAYFNARILALSIRIINALRAGEPVGDRASDLDRLLRSEPVARWLGSSPYARPAEDLAEELRSASRMEGPGRPLPDLARESLQLKRELSQERARLEFLRNANTYEYNARVDDHNRRVRAGAALFRRYRRRARELARVEVAFNRCLDPKILFTRFSRVDIRAATAFEDDEDSASP